MYHNLVPYSSTEGHIVFFQVLVIMSKAAINMYVGFILIFGKVFNSFG